MARLLPPSPHICVSIMSMYHCFLGLKGVTNHYYIENQIPEIVFAAKKTYIQSDFNQRFFTRPTLLLTYLTWPKHFYLRLNVSTQYRLNYINKRSAKLNYTSCQINYVALIMFNSLKQLSYLRCLNLSRKELGFPPLLSEAEKLCKK